MAYIQENFLWQELFVQQAFFHADMYSNKTGSE